MSGLTQRSHTRWTTKSMVLSLEVSVIRSKHVVWGEEEPRGLVSRRLGTIGGWKGGKQAARPRLSAAGSVLEFVR